MSAREWKPGEIWLVECPSWAPGEQRGVRYNAGWYWLDDSDYFINDGIDTPAKRPVTPLRPLLVIDPEDMAQVNDLIGALAKARSEDPLHAVDPITVQAALRSLLAPPKPPEPQGLGAVVRDADGETWVRVNIRTGTPEWRSIEPAPTTTDYSSINAVEVLSEGVQP